jgi:coiled-coil domain-containing protein 55
VQYERQLARERAAEEHLYGEKERFVTSAYRKKMEEEATWAAERKAKEAEEERNAVENKGHMGDFYRNLLRNNVAFGTAEPGSGGSGGGDKAEPSGAPKAPGSRPEAAARREAEGEEDIMPERRAAAAVAEAAAAERVTAAERVEPPAPHLRDAGDEKAQPRSPPRSEEPAERGPAEEPVAVVAAAVVAEPVAAAGTRRNRDDAVASAKERYLARKRKAESMQ